MYSRLASLLFIVFAVSSTVALHADGPSARRHSHLHRRLAIRDSSEPIVTRAATASSGSRRRRSCVAPKPAVQAANSTAIASAASTASPIASSSSSSSSVAAPTSSKTPASAKPASTPNTGSSSGSGTINDGVAFKPANWPSATQASAAPAATRTSAADPFLMQLSKSFNNADNALYNQVHVGQMTYYGQGLGACGDTYDDSSFTAAVSKLMYDTWPGATAETNRNPICGPYVPGRKVLNQAGQWETAVPGPQFVNVGGDGLLNCDVSSQCHIPLTATVKHGDKSIIVKIVDRCEACAEGDIDMTPTAFAALADMSLGRTSVEWFFNKY